MARRAASVGQDFMENSKNRSTDREKSSSPSAPPSERQGVSEDRIPARVGDDRCIVVGVGASAGGLDAFKRFLKSLPEDSGVAYVLIQHLDPTHDSMMVELLSKHTSMPVESIRNEHLIEPNHVYMIPPNRFVAIEDRRLYLEDPVTERGVRLPIDYFFRSLAADRKQRSVGIVLSGTGSDGAEGLRDVKGEGGMTVAQDPDDAEHDGMPRSAALTGAVDYVLPIAEMANVILPYATHPYVTTESNASVGDKDADEYRKILHLLKAHTAQDFLRYKRGTITRRIQRRMGIRHIETPAAYLELLRKDNAEVQSLFRDMLIGVTRYFRDSPMWNDLKAILQKRVLERRGNEPYRVWVPGCSTGEEAYSLAMMLFDQQERQHRSFEVQIFATDIDVNAIERARSGVYSESVAKDIPPAYVETYLNREGERLHVRKRLRETVVFAVQNLLSDPPFSGLDIISCRNLLIYLDPKEQQRIFELFHFALKPDGILILGSSESPSRQKELFKAVSQSSRIFKKIGAERHRRPQFPPDRPNSLTSTAVGTLGTRPATGPYELASRFEKVLLDEFVPASVVLDEQNIIRFVHGSIGDYVDFPSGEPSLDLRNMAVGPLKAKIRTSLQKARSQGRAVSTIARRVPRGSQYVDVRISVQPTSAPSNDQLHFLVSFFDEVSPERLDETPVDEDEGDAEGREGVQTDRELMLELNATREDLQSTIEEMESANEELKASNEEVMSMNEELQSTNEELETSREELQSLNEELSTVNNQLHDKVEELEITSNDLSNLLSSTDMATLFLDPDLRIRRYTPATARLMNLRDTDLGRPMSDLASRVDDPDLIDDAREVLNRLTPVEREVETGEDQHFIRRVLPFRTSDNKIDGVVITYSDVSTLKSTLDRVALRERQQSVIAQLGRIALEGQDFESLLEQATCWVAETLGVDFAQVQELRHESSARSGPKLSVVAGFGWNEGVVGQTTLATGIESQGGFTLQSSGAVIVRDLAAEKRFRVPAMLKEHGVVCGMSVTVGSEEAPWGVLLTHHSNHVEFTVDDTNFITAVANVLGEAIQRRENDATVAHQLAEIDILYRNAPVGLCFLDRELRYVRANEALASMNGQSVEDHLGRTVRDVVPDLADVLEPIFHRVLETGRPETRKEVKSRSAESGDDGPEWLASYAPLVIEGEVVGINATVVEITEQKRVQIALDRSRAKLQELVDSASVGIAFAKDDGTVLQANDAMLEIFSIEREEFERHGWDWQDKVLPNDEQFARRMRRLGESGSAEPIELQREDSDGDSVWVLASARPIDDDAADYIAFMADITAQKSAERAVQQSEKRLRAAARLAGFGAFHVNLRSGRVHCSDELLLLLGRESFPSTLDGIRLDEIVGPEEIGRVESGIRASLDPSGDGTFDYELQHTMPDGGEKTIHIQSRTTFRGRGRFRRAAQVDGFGLDITESRAFERELMAARSAADAANEAKSLFLANMSHEIRTPMTAVLGYADLLDDRVDDPEDRALIRTIRQNGEHLCQVLNDILDLAKIESGKLTVEHEDCDIFATLAETRELMAVRASQKGLTLDLEVVGEIPRTVRTDCKMLRQILLNLIGNAIKFTDEGLVRVSVSCSRADQRCSVEVTDTGVGIEAERIERLFEAFEQIDNSSTRQSGGTGLGLSITRRLIGLLGGSIEVKSRVGKGSTFRFDFDTGPLEDVEWHDGSGERVASAQPSEPDDEPELRGRILAADDRRDIRMLIGHFLEEAGAEVVSVVDGAECVTAWLNNRDERPFDAIVIDVQMPNMDGHEATRRIRAHGFEGPIIALTANALRSDQEKCIEVGCSDFVPKPIDRLELLRKLSWWMNGDRD